MTQPTALHAIREARFSTAHAKRASGLGVGVFNEIMQQRIAYRREDKNPDLTAWEVVYGSAMMRLKIPKALRSHHLLQLSARDLPDQPFVVVRLASKAVLVVWRSGLDERFALPGPQDLFDPGPLIESLAALSQ